MDQSKVTNDTFSLWGEEGSLLLPQNFEEFRSLVAQTRDYAECGKYNEAAAYGQSAALYACLRHCGLFVSPELEQIFLKLGQKAIPKNSYTKKKTSLWPETPRKILHVATHVSRIGGLTKFIWRWIQQDAQNSHSLVLTQQASSALPKILKDSVLDSHGKIYALNETIGSSIISWAKRLSEIAASMDIVVLHIWPADVIPIIAFANKEQHPPIIFVDHADHHLWLGASISDVVVNLRESGMRLSQERRGIEAKRNVLLPTILSPIHRTLSQLEAKQKLGLAENSVVLLSMARAPKYRTIDSTSFADAHVPLLERYEQAVLVVIGPDNSEDWSAAIQRTQGRIRVFGEREDTAVFLQAADIYVDTFPFISITSQLEAGSYGVPLVSRYPYSDACAILGADAPGLDEQLIRARDLEEYTAVLSRLVEDEKYRMCLGETTRRKITEIHMGSNWQDVLNDVYIRATTLPRLTVSSTSIDRMFLGEPDVILPRWLSYQQSGQGNINLDKLIEGHPFPKPFSQRMLSWMKTIRIQGVGRMGRLYILLPEWLYWRLVKLKNNKWVMKN